LKAKREGKKKKAGDWGYSRDKKEKWFINIENWPMFYEKKFD